MGVTFIQGECAGIG